ncbi:class I SAM-dependent methyltransferase [Streptomyces sp. NPDC127084]|uniref:class I SAM-dependent methyltransferase n=1 Tax=Streptomyces sp. NPDC127084 TaxID=3347133 RepID=UPI0036585D53
MSDSYILGRELPGEETRLLAMSTLLDPIHRRHLRRLGIAPGWRCLEVGAGNGSMARWLACQVGPTGMVEATDIDVGLLAATQASDSSGALVVRRLNIVDDPVEPAAYDLITARAVLHHIPARAEALRNIVAALKPGRPLLVLEPDLHPAFTAPALSPLQTFWDKWLSFAATKGVDYLLGRRLPDLLDKAGLCDVQAVGETPLFRGGAGQPGSDIWTLAFDELRDAMSEFGFSAEELDEFQAVYRSPGHWLMDVCWVAAWGYRPPDEEAP